MKATQLVPLPSSISMSPEQSASAVANTVASDILNRDGEGRKDDIPQGKVSVDDLTQEILDGRNNRKVNNIKKRPATSDHKEQPTKKQKDSIPRPCKIKIPFPGVPKKACPPMDYKDFRIYMDTTMQAWRVKKVGERKDKAASWKNNPQDA